MSIASIPPRAFRAAEVYVGHWCWPLMAIVTTPHETRASVSIATTEEDVCFIMLSVGARNFQLAFGPAVLLAEQLEDGGPFKACPVCETFHLEIATALRDCADKLRARIN